MQVNGPPQHTGPFIVAVILTLTWAMPSFAIPNDEQRIIIENAVNLSRLTGRPILAVAGSNT